MVPRASLCYYWCSTSGSPICGLCRFIRAVQNLPGDPRLTAGNYDLVHSILERSLGEVNGWPAVPLGTSPGIAAETPAVGKEEVSSSSGHSSSGEKRKRRSRDRERREDWAESRQKPPTPPRARTREPQNPPEEQHPAQLEFQEKREWHAGKKPKNKGKKHRERGIAYREKHWGKDASSFGQPDGPTQEARSSFGPKTKDASELKGQGEGQGQPARAAGKVNTSA